MTRNVIFKLQKIKDYKKQGWGRKKHLNYRRAFNSETRQTRREWRAIYIAEGKNQQSKILYPGKLSLKSQEKIKTFSGKLKLKNFAANRSALHEML